MLVGPQGDTGVEGGVNGLNPGVGFLSQALWGKRTHGQGQNHSSAWASCSDEPLHTCSCKGTSLRRAWDSCPGDRETALWRESALV